MDRNRNEALYSLFIRKRPFTAYSSPHKSQHINLSFSPNPLPTIQKNISTKNILHKIKALTLHQGKMTTGKRSSPVPQLQCVGGTAGCKMALPKQAACITIASDGFNVFWKCTAEMKKQFKFGKIKGYNSPKDPNILEGSCAVQRQCKIPKVKYQFNKSKLRSTPPCIQCKNKGTSSNCSIMAMKNRN